MTASWDNHRGISLLSIAGKIVACVILKRILHRLLDHVVSESVWLQEQQGAIDMIDMIFTLCQLQEKCREQNQNLYILFVDLTKAVDTVNRESLWSIFFMAVGFTSAT